MLRKYEALFGYFLLVVLLIAAKPAHAYLDAGSGSMILQLLLGGFAGLAVILKLYWRNLKAMFQGKKSEEDGDIHVDSEHRP